MVQDETEMLAEYRLYLTRARDLLTGDIGSEFLDYEEFDRLEAFTECIGWKKDSAGSRLGRLLQEIICGFRSSDGGAEFHPDYVLALVEVLETLLPTDMAPRPMKPWKKK